MKKKNPVWCSGNVCFIKTLNNGSVHKFDKGSLNIVSSVSWYTDSFGYLMHKGRDFSARLHNLLIKHKHGYVIDHIDRNKGNNLFSNLRQITHQANLLNNDRKSKVYRRKDTKKWSVQVREPITKKRLTLGSFSTKEEALNVKRCFIKKMHNIMV
jgi:hypothetical protein